MNDTAWARELERRFKIYDEMEASGDWPGRLGWRDYLAMAALLVIFTAGPWLWVQ